MNIQNTILVCCSLAIGLQVNAEDKKNRTIQQEQSVNENVTRIDKQVSELMASRITTANVGVDELAVARLEEYNKILAYENLMFPADELYNSNWDTIHVDPFQNSRIDFPESYIIDCKSFVMPLDQFTRVNSKYGFRRRRMHRGIDLNLNTGDTVRAAFDGKVRIKSYERRGYGNYLVIRHPNGLETVYGHLSKFLVSENQIVRAGQVIALGGNTGRSTGAHLHFETRFLGKDFNPAEIIDFENGVPHKNEYEFKNIKVNGKKSNTYATSEDAISVHRVKSGETLGGIARKYGTSVSELCKLNGIKSTSTLSIGQAIRFRTKQIKVEATPQAIKQTAAASSAKKTTGKTLEVAVTGTSSGGQPEYHLIQEGETLYSVAKKYGTTVEKLCELNNIQGNFIVKVGQKIRL